MAGLFDEVTDPYTTDQQPPGGMLGDMMRWLYRQGGDPQSGFRRYLSTSAGALGEAPAGIAQGVGDIGTLMHGLAQRQGMAEAGLPPAPESELAPLGPGARALGGLSDFLTGGYASHGLAPGGALTAARSTAPMIEDALRPVLADTSGAGRLPRAAPVEPKYPQYAEQYPPVGPPNIKINEQGNPYPEKQLTPEAIAFAKERNRIAKDMEVSGYTPYFDPAQRSYVDPANYPPRNVDTATVVPSKPATVKQYAEAIGAPETAAALRHAYDKGLGLGDTQHWYAMAQLEKAHIDELGPTAGRQAFLDEFAVPMGATTSGQNPTANLVMSHYLEYLRKRGEPIPVGNQLPSPVGGQYGQTNLDEYARVREAGGYPGLGANTPKMHDFARSMIGDLTRPVMDDQMTRGMLAHVPANVQGNARKTAYGMLQQPVMDLTAELNAANPTLNALPGNIQDVAWAGFKNQSGQPMISIVNDAIERTHRLTGMPRDEIVRRGLVRKEIPLYGLLGAAGAGGAANQ